MIELERPALSLEDRETYLKHHRPQAGQVWLVTCDRLEIYRGSDAPSPQAVRHLFEVAAGLDSPLLGETAVLGQVRTAYQEATQLGPLSSGLHRLFQAALRAGKRVRTETHLSRGAVGHGQVVYQILKSKFSDLKNVKLLFLGVNKLNWSILSFLHRDGANAFWLGNRTLEKAQVWADEFNGQAFELSRLKDFLPQADVVISATSAPHLIVKAEQLSAESGPKLFFDLAVPRDIDPQIALIPGVELWNVQDLEAQAQKNLDDRKAEVQKARLLIEEEVRRFFDALESRRPFENRTA